MWYIYFIFWVKTVSSVNLFHVPNCRCVCVHKWHPSYSAVTCKVLKIQVSFLFSSYFFFHIFLFCDLWHQQTKTQGMKIKAFPTSQNKIKVDQVSTLELELIWHSCTQTKSPTGVSPWGLWLYLVRTKSIDLFLPPNFCQ